MAKARATAVFNIVQKSDGKFNVTAAAGVSVTRYPNLKWGKVQDLLTKAAEQGKATRSSRVRASTYPEKLLVQIGNAPPHECA